MTTELAPGTAKSAGKGLKAGLGPPFRPVTQ
jgi:hypothetical protein